MFKLRRRVRLPRRILATVAITALAAATLVACVPSPGARAVVGANGFTASISGVTVSGPAGVAPEGTAVQLAVYEDDLPPEVGSFAKMGTAVSITLNGGELQPDKPLQVSFRVEDPVADSVDDPLVILGEDQTTGSGVAFLESDWDQDHRTLTSTVEHLSWFALASVNPTNLGERIGAWINESLGARTSQPSCVGNNPGLLFTVTEFTAWPCGKLTDAGIRWELYSNSPLVWEVLTDPQAAYTPVTALTGAGMLTIIGRSIVASLVEGDTMILPGEKVGGTFELGEGEYLIDTKVEPRLSQIATIAFGLTFVLPPKLVETVAGAECLVSLVKSGTSVVSGETFRTVLSCFATAIGGAVGALVGILLTAPALLGSQLEGIIREITAGNRQAYVITLVEGETGGGVGDPADNVLDSLPAGAQWLHNLPTKFPTGIGFGGEREARVFVDSTEHVFAHSTSMRILCTSTQDIIYQLYGNWTELSFAAGVAGEERALGGGNYRFILDGALIGTAHLEWGEILPRQTLSVAGGQELTIESEGDYDCDGRVAGMLLDAYVR